MSQSLTEQKLRELGIDYVEKEIALSEIDIEESVALGQVRDEPTVARTVTRYTRQVMMGQAFPPIVVHMNDKGHYLVDDGIQRTTSYGKADRETIKAFVLIDPTDFQLRQFRREANAINGEPLNDDERVRHAVDAVVRDNLAIIDAAIREGAPEEKVHQEVERRRALERMRRVAPEAIQLATAIQKRLNNIKSDEVFAEAARVAYEMKATTGDIGSLVTKLNKKREPEDQKILLAAFEQELRPRHKQSGGVRAPKRIVTKYDRALTLVGSALRDSQDELVAHAEDNLTAEARAEWAALADDVGARLRGFAKVLRQVGKA